MSTTPSGPEPVDPVPEPEDERQPGWSDTVPTWLTVSVIVVILVMWVANILVGFIDPTRSNAAVNPAFMIILGYLFVRSGVVGQLRRRAGRGNDPEDRG